MEQGIDDCRRSGVPTALRARDVREVVGNRLEENHALLAPARGVGVHDVCGRGGDRGVAAPAIGLFAPRTRQAL